MIKFAMRVREASVSLQLYSIRDVFGGKMRIFTSVSEQWQRQIFMHPIIKHVIQVADEFVNVYVFNPPSAESGFIFWKRFYKTRTRQIFYYTFCIEILILVSETFKIKSFLSRIYFSNHFYFKIFFFLL